MPKVVVATETTKQGETDDKLNGSMEQQKEDMHDQKPNDAIENLVDETSENVIIPKGETAISKENDSDIGDAGMVNSDEHSGDLKEKTNEVSFQASGKDPKSLVSSIERKSSPNSDGSFDIIRKESIQPLPVSKEKSLSSEDEWGGWDTDSPDSPVETTQ